MFYHIQKTILFSIKAIDYLLVTTENNKYEKETMVRSAFRKLRTEIR